jgi:hypothetical protein
MSGCKGNHNLAPIHSCSSVRIEWCQWCGIIFIKHYEGDVILTSAKLVEPPQNYRVLTDVPADLLEWSKEIAKTD